MPRIGTDLKGAGDSPKPPSFPLSPQQETAINFVRQDSGNAILIAVAGAGKTSTLVEMCKYTRGSVAFAAFNKKIADEIGTKLLAAGVPKSVRASTFHSFGFQAWRRAAGNPLLNEEKLQRLCATMSLPRHLGAFARRLVSLARQHAIGCGDAPPIEDWNSWELLVDHFDLEDSLYSEDFTADIADLRGQAIGWAQRLLRASNDCAAQEIDFDDMLYAPLYFNASFFQNDWVLIDEAQDTNPIRRMIAARMLRPGGRLIAVGDPHQAIYGFTGADADALDLIQREFDCVGLPLTVSFRCAQAIVTYAQQWVSHIQPAASAPQGSVRFVPDAMFRKMVPGREDAILCRNTKPLVQMALSFIRRRIPAHVEGRDIGQSLLALVNRWKSARNLSDLASKLELYRETESRKLIEQGREAKLYQVNDRVDSVLAILETLPPEAGIYECQNMISRIFQDTDGKRVASITLSTVHKAKGREWAKVYLYGRNRYMPSSFARQDWELEQEHNLIYVAVTRAKTDLVEVELPAPNMASYQEDEVPDESEPRFRDHNSYGNLAGSDD